MRGVRYLENAQENKVIDHIHGEKIVQWIEKGEMWVGYDKNSMTDEYYEK